MCNMFITFYLDIITIINHDLTLIGVIPLTNYSRQVVGKTDDIMGVTL